ncbi:hypothetical protein ACIQVL_48850 [Streptomyces sp. NPDC090499]|uniref:hypothetical protein n=1 Tax=Streptomyces sp. NPDC090499 TaxID=3365965 RepID=UPI0037F8D216
MDAPDLLNLTDAQYEELLSANINPKMRDTRVWELLTGPEHLPRTRELLARIHQRTANSMRRKKAEREEFHQQCHARGIEGKAEWFATLPEYEAWRRRAAYFHQTAQAALSELGKIQRSQNRAVTSQSSQQARETLRKLAIAVQRHQALHAKAGSIAGQEDYELWQLLDRLTVPCGPGQEQTTLRTMLDFYWTDVDVVDDREEARAAAEKAMRRAPGGRSNEFTGMPRARHVGSDKPLAG